MLILLWMFLLPTCYTNHTLLFNTPDAIFLYKGVADVEPVVTNLSRVTSMDYLHQSSSVCWITAPMVRFSGEIACSGYNATGGVKSVITETGVFDSKGIASDWLTLKLYWTDVGNSELYIPSKIAVVSLKSKLQRTLYWQDLHEPHDIAVDPLVGFVFWSDWGGSPRITRASMDGDQKSRRDIVTENVYLPSGVSLDARTKELFWVDGQFSSLDSCDYDGKNRRELWREKYMPYPVSVSVAADAIYWTDWEEMSLYSLGRKNSSTVTEILHMKHRSILSVQVADGENQPYQGTPCDDSNGGCAHLCLLSSGPERYSCACTAGSRLVNKTCRSEESFLLAARGERISKILLDSMDTFLEDIPLKRVKGAVGVDYDPVEGTFYWTDQKLKSIKRALLNGSNEENVIATEVFKPSGIAVDWMSRNLYWADTTADWIEMYSIATGFRKVLIFEEVVNPHSVAVAPQVGFLFWTECDVKEPKIRRADVDGTNVDDVFFGNGCPTGLALDMEKSNVYWADAENHKIGVVSFEGWYKYHSLLEEDLHDVYGLALLGDYLYWTDSDSWILERVDKSSGKDRLLMLYSPDLHGIKAVNTSAESETNACSTNNGDCDHFCVQKPKSGLQCFCQVDYELADDNRTCLHSDEFLISHSSSGVHKTSVRDGQRSEMVPISRMGSVDDVSVHILERRVYWADTNRMAQFVNRAFINGSLQEVVIEFETPTVDFLAVDWLHSNLYWTDTWRGRIEAANSEGKFRRVLVWKNLVLPRHLVLHPRFGLMFWCEWNGRNGTIVKATMDGQQTWLVLANRTLVNGLTIDYDNGKLYWTGYRSVGYIESCDFEGTPESIRTVMLKPGGVPTSIVLNEKFLYYAIEGNLMRANKTDPRSGGEPYVKFDNIYGLQLVNTTNVSGRSSCANTTCKYLCLARPSRATGGTAGGVCVCPSHHTMRLGVCYPPDTFVLFSQHNTISRLSVNLTECPYVPLPVNNLVSVRSVQYDVFTELIYWIDGNAIKRGNGTYTAVVVENGLQEVDYLLDEVAANKRPRFRFYDIALDAYSKLLFFSCAATNSIYATRVTHRNYVECVLRPTGAEKPRILTLHPLKGLLFFVDVERKHIARMRFNGEEKEYVHTEGEIATALHVDLVADTLFFAYSGRLYAYTLQKKGNPVFLTAAAGITHLAAMDSFLYLVQDSRRIQRMTQGGLDLVTVAELPLEITGLVAVMPKDDILYKSHPCSEHNHFGNCSHICLVNPPYHNLSVCSCPIGLVMHNNKTCYTTAPCDPDYFICRSSKTECVPQIYRCDSDADCSDGSDEEDCRDCGRDGFSCDAIDCVESTYVCDGVFHCDNRFDEFSCCSPARLRAGSSYVSCDNGTKCVPPLSVCDGRADCLDGLDETRIRCSVPDGNVDFKYAFVMLFSFAVLYCAYVWYYKAKSGERRDEDRTVLYNPGDDITISPSSSRENAEATSVPQNSSSSGSRITSILTRIKFFRKLGKSAVPQILDAGCSSDFYNLPLVDMIDPSAVENVVASSVLQNPDSNGDRIFHVATN